MSWVALVFITLILCLLSFFGYREEGLQPWQIMSPVFFGLIIFGRILIQRTK